MVPLLLALACAGEPADDTSTGEPDTDADTDADADADSDADTDTDTHSDTYDAYVRVYNAGTTTLTEARVCAGDDCLTAQISAGEPGNATVIPARSGRTRAIAIDELGACDETEFDLAAGETHEWYVTEVPGTWSDADGCLAR
ncbi:MAG: hypothetical protein ACOZNI_25675 [Myxococcota bacterium]